MAWVRSTYGVPCRRGVLVRPWYCAFPHEGAEAERGCWRIAAHPSAIRSASYLVFGGIGYHPTHGLEYIDADGFRLWPITEAEIAVAGFPSDFARRLAPLRPTVTP